MRQLKATMCVLLLIVLGTSIPNAVHAAISSTGDVAPANPSTWTNSTTAYIGQTSTGTVTVDSGSTVQSFAGYLGYNTGANGTVTVTGAGSNWQEIGGGITVGVSGTGTLNILSGGTVKGGYETVGNNSGASGRVTIDGSGSTWNCCATVGFSGTGTVNITNGGTLTGSGGDLGWNAGSSGTINISGPGSQCVSSGEPTIGYYGNGAINVTGGATFSGTGAYCELGESAGSSGTITVDGAGSTFAGGNLFVGSGGRGALNISNGGALSTGVAILAPSGAINFGGTGGTLTAWGVDAAPSQLTGTGTINTGSIASDVNLLLNSPASLNQTLTFNALPGQDVTVNLSLTTYCAVLGAGWQNRGSLTIQNGTRMESVSSYIGHYAGSTGVVTVDGAGSTWTCDQDSPIPVGDSGNGTLNVTNGGYVDLYDSCDIGNSQGATGLVAVTGRGSKLSAYPGGVVVGNSGSGTLTISAGGSVSALDSVIIGYASGSAGAAMVDGAASTLGSTSTSLIVGDSGTGTLRVTNGGAVNSYGGYVGDTAGSAGAAAVDGAGSKWAANGPLYVGNSGAGSLSISGGGTVTAVSASVNSLSLLEIDVGRSSSLSLGSTGTLANNGTVRVVAGADVPAGGAYAPISANSWSGTGTLQAVGGTWKTGNSQFTASSVVAGTSGTPVAFDLSSQQRALISDPATGWSLGASFLASTSPDPFDFQATAIGGSEVAALQSLLPGQQSVMGAWSLAAASGYAPGDPAYLSFSVGPGFTVSGLEVWQYNGNNWSPYAATDLTDDGSYASFTVTNLGDFAVSAVPEPSAIALMLASAACLLGYGWRRRKRNS